MDEHTQQTVIRRRRKPLAPWERTLRRFWPPVRLALVGAIAVSLIVLLISCAVAAFV